MSPRWAWLVALVAALVAKFYYVVVVGVRVDVRERVPVWACARPSSAADFSASGTDGGGGNGPHGRDGGRVALPSGPWASV